MALGRCTRRSLYFYSMPVLVISLLVGCGLGGPAGKYVSEKNSDDFLELKSDGTFTVIEGRSGFTGKYEIDGDQIILKADIGLAQRGRIEGQTIIDNEGTRWTKQGARKAGEQVARAGSTEPELAKITGIVVEVAHARAGASLKLRANGKLYHFGLSGPMTDDVVSAWEGFLAMVKSGQEVTVEYKPGSLQEQQGITYGDARYVRPAAER